MLEVITILLIVALAVVVLWRPLLMPLLFAIALAIIKTMKYSISKKIVPGEKQWWKGFGDCDIFIIGEDHTGLVVTNKHPNESSEFRSTYVVPHSQWKLYLRRNGLWLYQSNIENKKETNESNHESNTQESQRDQ